MRGHVVALESGTQESSHKVLETLKEELKFLPVMVREQEQVLEGGLLTDSIGDFRCLISLCSACC